MAHLILLLAEYGRHESPNQFLKLLRAPGLLANGQPTDLMGALLSVTRATFVRVMFPISGVASGSGWGASFAQAVEWTAHMLTLEDYLPSSISNQLSSSRVSHAYLRGRQGREMRVGRGEEGRGEDAERRAGVEDSTRLLRVGSLIGKLSPIARAAGNPHTRDLAGAWASLCVGTLQH